MQKQSSLLISFSFLLIAFIIVLTFLFSCKKESRTDPGSFYGKWKTSYGDTIEFAQVNSRNLVTYDATLNPASPSVTSVEYTYRDNKLWIKNGMSGADNFHLLQSFDWLEKDKSFKLQGVEWLPFISSTLTYFTFTKIQ